MAMSEVRSTWTRMRRIHHSWPPIQNVCNGHRSSSQPPPLHSLLLNGTLSIRLLRTTAASGTGSCSRTTSERHTSMSSFAAASIRRSGLWLNSRAGVRADYEKHPSFLQTAMSGRATAVHVISGSPKVLKERCTTFWNVSEGQIVSPEGPLACARGSDGT